MNKKINKRRIAYGILVGLIGIFIGIILSILIAPKVASYSPIALRELSEKENYQQYLFNQVGGDYKRYRLLKSVVACESSWRDDVYGDSGKAFGLFQYHEQTFKSFSKRYGKELDYKNPFHQIELSVWAFEQKSLRNHWTCFKLLSKNL